MVPLYGEYLTPQLVYRATVTNAVNKDLKKYIDWQVPLLKKEIVTTKETSSVRITQIAQNYPNTCGN